MQSEFAGSGMPPLLAAVIACEKRLWLGKRRVLRIMAVDPGVITGIAVLWIDADTGEIIAWAESLITHEERKMVWDLIELLRTLADFGRVWIVVEDFAVDMVNMSKDFLSPVRVGRAFAALAEALELGLLGAPVFGAIEDISWQGRGRKADYNDARLKVLGFYTPGPDHRRDATRHALVRWKRLKQALPANVTTRADWWEPALEKVPDAGTVRGFGRILNGKPTAAHGQEAPAKVTKEDLQRMAASRGRDNGKVTVVTAEMKAMAQTNGMNWVVSPAGIGWVLEHDPATQSGIAPRSGAETPVKEPLAPVSTTADTAPKPSSSTQKSPAATKTRRRMVKKLV